MALSREGRFAKKLDKKQDSGGVVKLVDKLRQVILIYQVAAVRIYLRADCQQIQSRDPTSFENVLGPSSRAGLSLLC